MKKILILMMLTLTLVHSKNNKSLLVETFKERLTGLAMNSCDYVPGHYYIGVNGTTYDVKDGYLVCFPNENNFITVFEGVVEEEDRSVILNIGTVTISDQ